MTNHGRVSKCHFNCILLSLCLAAVFGGRASAEIFINEIYFDPPASGDDTQEYVELRGTPNMMLDDHYLVFLENEFNSEFDDSISGPPGEIDFIFDLSGLSLSPTGYLTFRQKDTPYTLPAGPHDLINTGSGTGWGTSPADNTVGVSSTSGVIENSGFTAMLIHNVAGSAPTLGMKLDGSVDNDNDPATDYDGLDYPNGVEDLPGGDPRWEILDSIGVYSERDEAAFGRTYSPLTYGPEADGAIVTFFETSTGKLILNHEFHPNITDEQTYVDVGFEIEYVVRYGDSTGDSAKDWHVSNLTNETAAGFVSAADGFRQSAPDPHGFPRPDGAEFESNQFVPYGTNLTDTLGEPNYPLNQSVLPWDYNQNGVVDAADYTMWRDALGAPDPTGTGLFINADRDDSVDQTEYDAWAFHFGESLTSPGTGGVAGGGIVPEPASWLLVVTLVSTLCVVTRTLRPCSRSPAAACPGVCT